MDTFSIQHHDASTKTDNKHSSVVQPFCWARSTTRGRGRRIGIARPALGRRSVVFRVPKFPKRSNPRVQVPEQLHGWIDTAEPTVGIVPVDHDAVHGRPLDLSTLEIRLLHILPPCSRQMTIETLSGQLEEDDETVHCTMTRASLSTSDQPLPAFNALSYVWGKRSEVTNIVINSKPVAVTCNLESALRHLRDWHAGETGGLPIWVDAVCINQDDVDERSEQVGMMGTIYRRASRVLSWLGEGNQDTDWAIPLLRLGGGPAWNTIRGNTWGMAKKLHRLRGVVYEDLCRREYWYRLWIVQELVLARLAPILLVGTYSLCYHDYAVASRWTCEFVKEEYDRYCLLPTDIFLDTELYILTQRDLPYLSQRRRWHDATLFFDMMRAYINERGHVPLTHLFFLQDKIGELRASDPHDYVYALRGMLDAEAQSLITVDYSSDPVQTYHHATVAVILLSSRDKWRQSWDCFKFKRNLPFTSVTGHKKIPAWVFDFACRQAGGNDLLDTLGGRAFAHGKSQEAFLKASLPRLSSDKRILFFKGVYFDEIATTDQVSFPHMGRRSRYHPRICDLKRCLLRIATTEVCQSSPLASFASMAALETRLERSFFFFSLIGLGAKHVHVDGSPWRELILEILHSRTGEIDEERLRQVAAEHLRLQGLASDDLGAELDMLVRHLLWHLWRRLRGHKIFFTKAGFWGLGAGRLAVGDRIVFAFGTRCPFVVRPCNPAILEHEYMLLGFAEIYELTCEREMWEAAVENGDLETIDIRLV